MDRLINKFSVKKADGSYQDPKAQYFVLCVNGQDEAAREAVLAYAQSIESRWPTFAAELRQWIAKCAEDLLAAADQDQPDGEIVKSLEQENLRMRSVMRSSAHAIEEYVKVLKANS